MNKARRERDRAALSVDQLKKGDRVNVRLSPMSIFLMRDGMLHFLILVSICSQSL
jgi:hypothetical protein